LSEHGERLGVDAPSRFFAWGGSQGQILSNERSEADSDLRERTTGAPGHQVRATSTCCLIRYLRCFRWSVLLA